jgi:hypothetical protein
MANDKDKKGAVVLSNSERNKLAKTGNETGSFVKNAIANLDEESRKELGNYAGRKAIDLEAKKYEQEMDLDASTRDIENHIEAFNMLNKDGRLTRQKVTSDLKSGAGNMKLESKSGPSCFVATVCYGDVEHPDLDTLREFRDQKLASSQGGSRFIDWYYQHGPTIADYVENKKYLKLPIYFGIKSFVILLKKKRSWRRAFRRMKF